MPNVAKAVCDTSPLVAMADRGDASHKICRDAFALFGGNLVTTWAVLTEAFYFLDHPPSRNFLWNFVLSDGVQVADLSLEDLSQIRTWMEQYADLPMDFADASLVVLAERLKLVKIFTLDRRGFTVYKPRQAKAFDIFP